MRFKRAHKMFLMHIQYSYAGISKHSELSRISLPGWMNEKHITEALDLLYGSLENG